MKLELMPGAQRDLRAYFYHVAAEDLRAAERERVRILAELRRFAALPVDGALVEVEGLARPVHLWLVHPFRVYYERRGDTLLVHRLYHQARRPIEG